jgi:hypothetical protein
MASTFFALKSLDFSMFLYMELSALRCSRAAISGMTPPHLAWTSTWDEITELRTRRPFSTRAKAVSSQLDSIPKNIMLIADS